MGSRWALALALVVLAAGCAGPLSKPEGGGDETAGGLGPPGEGTEPEAPAHYKIATWNQTGLVDAFPNASEAYEIHRIRPEDGIPYHAPNLTAREGPLVLKQLTWHGPGQQPGGLGREQFRLEDAGTVTAFLEERRNSTEVRVLFERFARNVTTANRSTVDAWGDAFLENRREAGWTREGDRRLRVFVHEIHLDQPVDLDPLLDRLQAQDAEHRESLAGISIENATWWIRFDVPRVAASNRTTGTLTEVTATIRGEVGLTLGTPTNLTREEVQGRAREVFEDLGLGEPTFDGLTIRPFEPQ